MRGITRPCRHGLGPELHERWRAHLCGLCLTLRDQAGQAARVLTGYDLLLLSALVEAQAGRAETVTAGPCALRGFRRAEVIPSGDRGARLAAAATLLAGEAALEDKLRDGDLPGPLRRPAARQARAAGWHGARLAADPGLAPGVLSEAAAGAAAVEGSPGATLEELLAPSGRAVAELFARTADVSGQPGNRALLARAGDAFGRLAHLIDAVEDYGRDARRGAFNPLARTAMAPVDARRLADQLARTVSNSVSEMELRDPDLVRALLGPVLDRSIARTFRGVAEPAREESHRSAGAVLAAMVLPLVTLGIFGGRRRPPRGYYDPYYGPPPGYGGYGRRGPSCCDLLACDCCANMACDDCCGGGDDCCVCCC